MSFFKKYNPAGGAADFWQEFRRPNPYRWPILIASGLITFSILSMVIWEEFRMPPERPTITYISTFAEGRTDAEIAASNAANQQVQDEYRAAEEARLERQRDAYRTLGRATGIDVDAIDERIAREKAAEAARTSQQSGQQASETVASDAE